MKKQFITVCALTLFAGLSAINAQSSISTLRVRDLIDPNHSGNYDRNHVMDSKKETVEGSPYLTTKYDYGNIAGVDQLIMMRYNAYADEIEIQDGETKTYILPKKEEFSNINFKSLNYKLRLVNYTDAKDATVYGYLAEVAAVNGVSLFRRDHILLQAQKEAANSYDSDRPAKYIKGKPDFYLEQKDKKIIPFPKNKKGLQELYPSQKEAINTFFKENDYSFKDEKDLIKIAEFTSKF